MAKKTVQVKQFLNIDKLEIGYPAQFLGEDGLTYQTSPIEHFDIHPDGRVSMTTRSGSLYANYDVEAQRIKDNAEWDAKFTPEQKARGEEQERLYQLQAQNRANQQSMAQDGQFYEDCAKHICDRINQSQMSVGSIELDPANTFIWRNGATAWEPMPIPPSLEDLQTGTCIYLGNSQFFDAYNPNEPIVGDIQTQIREASIGPDGQFMIDTGTQILINGDLNRVVEEWNKEHAERETQEQTQDAPDPTDIF